MAKCNVLTAARLREVLRYNPRTGEFRWLESRWQRWRTKVGCVQTTRGYSRLIITIDYRHYRASRLAWLYMTGNWPVGLIDHRNGKSLDNRWRNLRDVNKSVNQTNRHGLQKNNTSGYRGVCFIKLNKPWRATFAKKWLGDFRTKKEAHAAVQRAMRSGGLSHTGSL